MGTRPTGWVAGAALFAAAVVGLAAHSVAAPETPGLPKAAAEILSRRCFACHGQTRMKGLDLRTRAGALKGGEHGPALVSGKPDESPLIKVISGAQEPRMPPGGHLTPAEIDTLKRWVAAGAEYPAARPIAPAWSPYSALNRPTPPAVKNRGWVRNPIDAFILAKLEAKGLSPAPPATRRELIRRLYFDLTGLPPSPEEVEAFVRDPHPQAYERLVDRLLASPRYGERWARHWLDVARFAESQGFERDKIRDHAWRYRDYVIKAFNEDKPYDRFVMEQIAGDVLPEATPETIVATGFLTAGPWDEVGASQPQPTLRLRVREDELEDMVAAVGQSFLGLTVNCARCHDHKFDPIPQRDYFRIQAAFAGVKHGDRALLTSAQLTERAARLKDANRQLAELATRRESLLTAARSRALTALGRRDPVPGMAPRPVARWTFEGDARDSSGALDATLAGGAAISGGRLRLNGKDARAVSKPLPFTVASRTLEAWVELGTLDQRGGGVITIENAPGDTFDAIVYGEREPRKWLAGSGAFFRTRDVAGPPERGSAGLIHLAITYTADHKIALYRNGEPYGEPYVPGDTPEATLQTYAPGSRILFGLRHTSAGLPGSNAWFNGAIEEARLYDRPLSPAEVRESFRHGPPVLTDAEVQAAFTAEDVRTLTEIAAAERRVREQIPPPNDLAYAANPVQPGPVHVLARGEVEKPGELVPAGGLSALTASGYEFHQTPEAPEAERRVALARWLVSPANPLTPRVMVNRVWQYHFGRGIIASPNDFGINGEKPTHPELLDWLAGTFSGQWSVVSGQQPAVGDQRSAVSSQQSVGAAKPQSAMAWSLKALHRLMVTSSTYRQSARHNPAAAAVDADNLLLWRMSPRRLEAEEIRDAMLAASGQLNLGKPGAEGGPGFRPFSVVINNTHFYTYEDRVGPEYNRRSIYRTVVNSGGVPLLEALDCPDPSVKAPRRSVTTTPIQALSLLNSSFVFRQSAELAKRVEKETRDPAAQADRLYRVTFGRPPTEAEKVRVTAFVRKNGLPALCRVILNASEFVYVR